MSYIWESPSLAGHISRIKHRILESEYLMSIATRLDYTQKSCKRHKERFCITDGPALRKEIILSYRRNNQKIVIEVNIMLTQTWYTPKHSLYGKRIE